MAEIASYNVYSIYMYIAYILLQLCDLPSELII